MVKQAQTLNPRRWSTRTLGLIGLPVVVAVLVSVASVQSWISDTKDLNSVKAEQRGVAYLQPLTDMLDRMIDAQTATVEGGVADTTAIREGIKAVDKAEREHGDELGSGQRWSDLRNRVNTLLNQRPTGEAAYRSYTDVIQLVTDLIQKIADNSKLVLDPILDSYYLMDAAVLRLPDVSLFAGRASDLARVSAETTDPAARAQSDTKVGVARYQVSLDSEAVAAGLRKAMDSTSSSSLGPNITNQLDTFRTAVDGFVPPVTLLQNLDSVDAITLGQRAGEVRQAAKRLIVAILKELDKLLQTRADAFSIGRMRTAGLGALSLLLTLGVLWTMVIRTRRVQTASAEGSAPAVGTDVKGGSAAAGGVRTRKPRLQPLEADAEQDQGESRVSSEELVRVGRGIRARRRERADDSR